MRIGPSRESRPADRKSVRSSHGPATPPSESHASQTQQAPTEGSELIGRLRSLPEIRSEVVDDVERRLHEGDLLTRQAAERTAEAILAEITASVCPDN
jgi:hypothetical protein